MKTKKLENLMLNKKVISNFKREKIKGGTSTICNSVDLGSPYKQCS